MAFSKDKIGLLVKTAVGIVLFYYVVRSGMIDFNVLREAFLHPFNLTVSVIFLLFSAVCCTLRWHLLVGAQGLSFSVRNLFSLTMIGVFFNTFMPGSVGGDLIKAWYVAGQQPQARTKAVFTVLADRVIGLAVIIFYAAITLLFYSEWAKGKPQLQLVALSIWGFTLSSFIFAILFFSPKLWKAPLFKKLLELGHRVGFLAKILDAALLYQNRAGSVFKAVLLSALSIFGFNLLYFIQGTSFGIPMTLPQYFFVVPLAMTVSAIPLLPGGIGTGQVAFYTLFQWIGVPDPSQGSTLCTLMQLYTILFNLLGAVFYLRFKRKPQVALPIHPSPAR